MGGSSSPKPMTTDTTSTTTQAPTVTSSTSTTNTQNKIPAWLENTSQSMLARANTLSQTPYTAYGGQRVAGFDPMMQEAFQRIGGQGVAGQVGTATGLAGAAGAQGLMAGQYDPYAAGQFTGATAQQYMSPYMQAVVNNQMQEAQRQADIATTSRSGAATRAGAFGGSRQAIMDAEAARNLAQQKGEIQATGLQSAYDQAQKMYTAEQAAAEQSRQFGANLGMQGGSQAISAAQALGGLGQTQFGQEMDITQGLGYAGSLAQQQQQTELDTAYQEFLTQQKYPYEQIAFLQGVTSGAPHSTSQISSTKTSGVSTPGAQTVKSNAVQTPSVTTPSALSQGVGLATTAYGAYDASQNAAAGGIVGYAEGGITELLSDQQLQQRQQNPNVPTIAKLAAEMQAQENARMRQGAMAQAGQVQAGRPTVAQEAAAGLEALPVPDDMVGSYADGGVMSYADGGGTYEPFYDAARRQGEEKGSIYDEFYGLPKAEREAARAAARPREIALPASTSTQEAELVRMQNPGDKVRVEGGGNFWDKVGGALTYSSDIEAAKARAAQPQRAAENRTMLNAAEQAMPVAGLPAVAPGATGRASAAQVRAPATQGAGLAATPEARTVTAAPASPGAAPAPSGLEAMLADARKSQDAAQADLVKVTQAENDALAAEAAANVKAFDERQEKAKDADKPARERISKREADLDSQRRQARSFAIIRAGLAMMSGESPHALVNIGRGAAAGLEDYAGRTAKIDEAREGLRTELDKLDALRTQAAAASGEKRDTLLASMRAAERAGKFATQKMLAASGVETNKAMTNAMFTALVKQKGDLETKKVEHGYDMEKARFEAGSRERVANIAASGRGGSTKGAVTAKDIAKIRDEAMADWDDPRKARALKRQYPTQEAYVRSRVANYTSAEPAATAGTRLKFDAQGNLIN